MIYVYYVSGGFVSTVEYVLKAFTNEYTSETVEISSDGSMHGFDKSRHVCSYSSYLDFFHNLDKVDKDKEIATLMYPHHTMSLSELVKIAQSFFRPTDKHILLYLFDQEYIEINLLFQYHKIINGAVYHEGLTSSMFKESESNITQWNPLYKTAADMQPWEFREWRSLIDSSGWLNADSQVPENFLKISNKDILNDTEKTFEKIINWCGLTRNNRDLSAFAGKWRQRQQYVLDEHKLIVSIVDATINDISMPIPPDLNIFAQAIIQQKLRNAGYELRCDGLNQFPNNAKKLHALLDNHLTIHTKDL